MTSTAHKLYEDETFRAKIERLARSFEELIITGPSVARITLSARGSSTVRFSTGMGHDRTAWLKGRPGAPLEMGTIQRDNSLEYLEFVRKFIDLRERDQHPFLSLHYRAWLDGVLVPTQSYPVMRLLTWTRGALSQELRDPVRWSPDNPQTRLMNILMVRFNGFVDEQERPLRTIWGL